MNFEITITTNNTQSLLKRQKYPYIKKTITIIPFHQPRNSLYGNTDHQTLFQVQTKKLTFAKKKNLDIKLCFMTTQDVIITDQKQSSSNDVIFRSKLPDIYIPNHLPLHDYIFENISEFAAKPCLINGPTGEVYTYADVHDISRKLAAGLQILGVNQHDVVMLLLPNSPEVVLTFLAASLIGAITTSANPFFTPAEISKQAKASAAKLIVTQSRYFDKIKNLQNDGVLIVTTDSDVIPENCLRFSELTQSGDLRVNSKISPDDVVALPFSSGTTGLPKGVMLTHKGLVTSVAQQVDGENPNLYFNRDDVILCVLPMFHIYALNSIMLCSLRVGATILIMPKFEITLLLEQIQRCKVTVAMVVPPIVLAIAKSPETEKYDLSSVRMVKSGAAPLGKELEDAISAKFPNAKLGQVCFPNFCALVDILIKSFKYLDTC